MEIPRSVPFLLSLIIVAVLGFTDTESHRIVYLAYILGLVIVFVLGPRFELSMQYEVGAYALLILGGFATFNGWWRAIPFFDKLVHFLIHLLVGLAAVQLWSRYLKERPGYLILASIGTVSLIGYIIELAEQIFWIAFGMNVAPPGTFYTDTMADFMVNIGGGLTGIGIWWARKME